MPITIPPMNPDVPAYRSAYQTAMRHVISIPLDELRGYIGAVSSQIPQLTGDPQRYNQALLNGYTNILQQRTAPPPEVTYPPGDFFFTINSTPQGQRAYIDATYMETVTPYRLRIASGVLPSIITAGRHLIQIPKPEFRTVRLTSNVIPGRDQSVTLPAAVRLTIPAMSPLVSRVQPQYQAAMQEALTLPIVQLLNRIRESQTFFQTTTGDTRLVNQAHFNGYSNIHTQREVQSIPGEFFFTINTTPNNQHVRIDAIYQSAPTPLTIKIGIGSLPALIIPGDHAISLAEPGFLSVSQSVTVIAGQNSSITLPQSRPRPEANKFFITSTPAGARISIDNTDINQNTPYWLYVIPAAETLESGDIHPGAHTVKLTLSGYIDQTKSVTVRQTGVTTLDFTLAAIPTEVFRFTITANVTNCRIFVDNADTRTYTPQSFIIGTGSASTHITPGTHTIRLTRGGYVTQEQSITVPLSQDLSVNFVMLPTQPPTAAEPPSAVQLARWSNTLDTIDAMITALENEMRQAGITL